MFKSKFFAIFSCISLSFLMAACASTQTKSYCTTYSSYSQRPQVQQFIQHVSCKHNFNPVTLAQLFDNVRPQPSIIRTMTAPHEGLPWYRYRALFLTPARCHEGATFWRQHALAFTNAQKRYGVPAEIIASILGVETNYGATQGNYRVIDALSTLAFDYPPRSQYFKGELEQFLVLTRNTPLKPLQVKGSYAGAIGQPQFMPSSYRDYSVDTTGKGYSDLIHTPNDAIASVANYFKAHGWTSNAPVAVRAKVVGHHYQALLKSSHPQTLAKLKNYGVTPSSPVAKNQQASLLALTGEKGTEYWLVFHNFKVIKSYNNSSHYAMAVDQLAQSIKRIKEKS